MYLSTGHPGLGGWEVVNEPEGSVLVDYDSVDCWDTTPLQGTGAGWVQEFLPMRNILQFINWQNSAIRFTDPGTLITGGAWSERSNMDRMGFRNYYKDQ